VQTCENPQIVGLDGENLDAQPWLKLYRGGIDTRTEVSRDGDVGEVWVVSCDDVEAINLAAALKSDRPELVVRLMDQQGGGSVLSRAHTASIDEVMGKRAFIKRYHEAKRLASRQAEEAISAKADSAPDKRSEVLALAAPLMLAEQSRPAHTVARSFLVPVVSGSGGAGKSTVAVLSALISHSMGRRTLLLDYDLQFGDAAVMMGVENPLAIDVALKRPDKLAQELERSDRPTLLAAPERLEMAESVAQSVPELLSRLEGAFDVVVANTGASWAEQHAALLERATATLFLIDQRSSSVRACRHALELCSRCGIATGQFQFVLNRCAKGAPLTPIDASFALQGVPVAELRDGGRDVEDYLSAGAASELLESGNELCTSLAQVLAGLLSSGDDSETQQAEQQKGRPGMMRRGRHGSRRKGWGK
jgi:pilus assembly protein CpaE